MIKLISLILIIILFTCGPAFCATATPTDKYTELLSPIPVDCTASNQTVTLVAALDKWVSFTKSDVSAHTLTINPAPGGYTILGQTSYTLYLGGETVMLILVGTDWKRM
jgi:hypothetical protein